MTSGPLRRHLAPLGAIALALAVVLAPSWSSGTVLGHAYGDLADHFWGTWWFGGELLAGRWPSTTNLSHFPATVEFWHIDPLGALLALPLHGLGPAFAWNTLVVLQLAAAMLVAYVAAYDATESRGAALVGGVVAGLSPYALGLVHSGLSECLWLAPVFAFVPLALRTLGLDPRGRPAIGWVAPGLALGLAASGAAYYGLFGVIFLLSCVLGRGWRARVEPAIRVALLAGLVALPAALLAAKSVGGTGAVTPANAPGWAGRLPATDILSFLAPGQYYFPDTPAMGNPGILHVNYLGYVAIGVAALGGWTAVHRAGLAYFAFALGPRLAFAKQVVTVLGASVLLPLGYLSFPGSPFGLVHQPYRMVAFLLPVLGLAAARGALRLPGWARPVVAVAVLAEVLLLSPAPWPLATRPAPSADAYAGIDGPVLDWPPDASQLNRDYLVSATVHGQAVPYGVNVFLPERLRQDPLVIELLRALNDLDGRARNRDVLFAGSVLQEPATAESALREIGIRHVLVHKDSLDDREWGRTRRALTGALGEPVREDVDTALWTVP